MCDWQRGSHDEKQAVQVWSGDEIPSLMRQIRVSEAITNPFIRRIATYLDVSSIYRTKNVVYSVWRIERSLDELPGFRDQLSVPSSRESCSNLGSWQRAIIKNQDSR